MGESWLHEAVCRLKPELLVRVGYMKLCVDRNLNCVKQFMANGRTGIYRCTAQQTVSL